MTPQQLKQAALGSVQAFRNRELRGLVRHLQKFGPLSETTPSTSSTSPSLALPNPFIPKKNAKTGRWHEPKYSLRRQAELVRKAIFSGTADLVPPGPKKDAFQLRLDRLKQEKLMTELPFEPYVQGTIISEARATFNKHSEEKAKSVAKILEMRAKLRPFEEEINKLSYENLTEAEAEAYIEKKSKIDRKADDFRYAAYDHQMRVGYRDRELNRVIPKLPAVEWDETVSWAGEYKPRNVPGAQLGIRLYAGKKRMFKGHRWERQKLGLLKRRAMLMRDMKDRVRNYKEYYKKRKPNPLKPSRYTKPPKLPF
ncbi:hypothetical protein CVT24_003792 [Panaeolus cyanescens]|uniref:Large ribosomal subunit protein mL59 domain-containing protein n=1 Tax=Panaeolus cyanescens TaxID=181874 RepID=A0A409W835_9AGAR|nr:hypothetical protein CVT24_003792 [Panaeolus cyanescens]